MTFRPSSSVRLLTKLLVMLGVHQCPVSPLIVSVNRLHAHVLSMPPRNIRPPSAISDKSPKRPLTSSPNMASSHAKSTAKHTGVEPGTVGARWTNRAKPVIRLPPTSRVPKCDYGSEEPLILACSVHSHLPQFACNSISHIGVASPGETDEVTIHKLFPHPLTPRKRKRSQCILG
ncbi:unnamed protein product [Cutaneotrichosporon oleaginosum]